VGSIPAERATDCFIKHFPFFDGDHSSDEERFLIIGHEHGSKTVTGLPLRAGRGRHNPHYFGSHATKRKSAFYGREKP
jgi:hypothetical protein